MRTLIDLIRQLIRALDTHTRTTRDSTREIAIALAAIADSQSALLAESRVQSGLLRDILAELKAEAGANGQPAAHITLTLGKPESK